MTLSSEQVTARLQGVEPRAIRDHGVEVNGVWFPVKQAFAEATGEDPLDFTTQRARDLLQRLGFTVKRF